VRIKVKFIIFLSSWLRTPVERNLARTTARARRDLKTKDIDVCVLLNSRVRIVQKVRWFRYHDGIIGEVSIQRNNQLVSQNVVMATLISP